MFGAHRPIEEINAMGFDHMLALASRYRAWRILNG